MSSGERKRPKIEPNLHDFVTDGHTDERPRFASRKGSKPNGVFSTANLTNAKAIALEENEN
jgi:hypothetical protein